MKENSKYRYNTDVSFLTPDNREDQIRALEEQRLELTAEMERIVTAFAKISGKRRLKKRAGGRVGKAVNDYAPAKHDFRK